MRRFLAASLLALSLASSASARADVYEDFLSGLRAQVNDAASFGYDARELQQIRAAVDGRPQMATEASYETYAKLLGELADKLATFGFDAQELEVLDTVARANPLRGQPVETSRYGAFLTVVSDFVDKSQTFGFDAQELRVLDVLVGARPGLEVPQDRYEGSYGAWQRTLRDTEQKLSSFGIDAQEAQVLDKLRALQPKLAVARPGRFPHGREPRPQGDDALRVCGQVFRGATPVAFGARAPSPVVTMLTESGDLVQVDGATCQQRWLADGVVSLGAPGQGAFVKRSGAFVLRGNDVYEVSEGRREGTRYRYSVRWQPLESSGAF